MIGEVMTWRHFFPAITDYNVPLVAEGGVGYSWGQAKNKKEAIHRIIVGYDEWTYQPNQKVSVKKPLRIIRAGEHSSLRSGNSSKHITRNAKRETYYL
jgi:hypothetical protein